MPYKSNSQRRFFYAAEARGDLPKGTAARWQRHTPKGADLPERVKEGSFMNFDAAFRDEIEKLAVAGRPLGRLMADAPPAARRGMADVVRLARKPLVVVNEKGVAQHDAHPAAARVFLAGMRGSMAGAMRSEGNHARATNAGVTTGQAQNVREGERLERQVKAGKITEQQAHSVREAFKNFPADEVIARARKRLQAAAEE